MRECHISSSRTGLQSQGEALDDVHEGAMEAWLARHSMCFLVRGYFWVVIVERMVARTASTTSRANFSVSAN